MDNNFLKDLFNRQRYNEVIDILDNLYIIEESIKNICKELTLKKYINFLGIAISSKLGKAVKRNYIKRIIREVYRNTEEQIKTGNTIVFLWKKNAEIKQACYENVKKDIEKIFKDAEIFLEE